ncbi:4Fe-4S dicluster domain-containing protein [archaeon]|nr:4Fe-4S dicluster domain-containing protein [archaeon]
MPVIINFKRCDLSPECSCMPACPTHAFYWHRGKPSIDLSKCVSCNKCVEACPAEAVLSFKTEKQLEKVKKKIAKDRMTHAELFKERYGAESTVKAIEVSSTDFDSEVLGFNGVCLVEFYSPETIRCRIKSIKFDSIKPGRKARIRKINAVKNKELAEKFGVRTTPSLGIFRKGKFIKLIEGSVDLPQAKELKREIRAVLKASN